MPTRQNNNALQPLPGIAHDWLITTPELDATHDDSTLLLILRLAEQALAAKLIQLLQTLLRARCNGAGARLARYAYAQPDNQADTACKKYTADQ